MQEGEVGVFGKRRLGAPHSDAILSTVWSVRPRKEPEKGWQVALQPFFLLSGSKGRT